MDQDKYIGRLLDNRYEIQEVIGVGGMAVVYKARCHRLNRLVAIKILKDELSRDEEFRRRFHAESHAVAMLSHPNIVSVYDVSSKEADYIVMELIDGITLKQYMEKKGILNWKETLHFAIQIAKALEHAHSRGIVHRDIKPHNVMVLKNGSVKVTDFGIAQVMSKSNTLTKEALGSVHYISPEQAKGGRVDNRSDLYSLGVVMYEMIAGRPPYDGESPVSVAIQHINGGAPMPSTLNPNIPGGLEQITMKAMAHDPQDRYDTATAMLYDMDEFRKNPLILFPYALPVTPNLKEIPLTTPRKTTAERVATNRSRTAGSASAGRTAAAGAAGAAARRRTGATSQTGRTSRDTGRRRPADAAREEDRSRVATIAIVACSVVAIVAVVIFLITLLNGGGMNDNKDELIKVPDLKNMTYEPNMVYEGFEIRLSETYYDDTHPENMILDQNPKADVEVSKESMIIYVDVSMGPEPQVKTMENLIELSLEDAKKYLIGQRILDANIFSREEFHDTIPAGKVCRTDPAYTEVMSDNQIVTIWVSKGPETVKTFMPYVVGLNYNKAYDVLVAAKITHIEPIFVDSNKPEGEVVGQNIDRNVQIDVNTTIYLEVSNGPTEPPKTEPPETTVPPTTVPPTTVPPTTAEETTQAPPVIVQKTVTVSISNPPAEEFTLQLVNTGDIAFDGTLAGGTTSITVTFEGYDVQYFDVCIDGVFTGQVVKVDFTA